MHLLKMCQKIWSAPPQFRQIQTKAFFFSGERPLEGTFHSHPYHIIFSQQGISRYMVVYLSSKARRGTGRLVNKFSTGDHGGHEEGAGVGGRVGQDRSHSFLRPLHTALFISSAGFSSRELGSNLQSHTDST